MSIPSIDIIFDTSLFPSAPGGQISHAALMGRPSRPSIDEGIPALAPSQIPAGGLEVGDTVRGRKRSNSFSGGLSVNSSNRAGIGAGIFRGGLLPGSVASGNTTHGNSQAGVRRSPSVNEGCAKPSRKGHTRIASDSSGNFHRPSSSRRINLGNDPAIPALLAQLQSLIPPSRQSPVNAASNTLDPACVINHLTRILEALVSERSALRNQVPTSLPTLANGVALTLSSGSLNWAGLASYLRAIADLVDALIPRLRNNMDSDVVDMISTVRIYVRKAKKVFGEIAAMYVDEYAFVRGWWDEAAMKECAGIVGKWGSSVWGRAGSNETGCKILPP